MSSVKVGTKATQAATAFMWVRITLTYLLIPLILLLCGGDGRWWQAWVLSVLIISAGVGGRIWAERRHPGLMVERERAKSDRGRTVKPWDRVLAPLMAAALSFPPVLVAGLDHRRGWSPVFPTWLNVLGMVLITGGYALAVWALAENRFFSSMVRIQKDRGHTVCDSGPYRRIRHPGYAGNAVPVVGMVLALGSLWTMIPAAAAIVLIVVRTILEDRTLREELPGYQDYSQRVRYRLVPGIF